MGVTAAWNQGLQLSSGQYICIANNDLIFSKNCVKILQNTLEKHKWIGLASPYTTQDENISIGDSALDYFSETELENGELDWFNYSYKEFATSLVSGKGIYDWFKISYRSDDDNFKIEGLVGIVVKKKI